MNRCLKYIKQDEGIEYKAPIADNDDDLPKMEGIITAETQINNESKMSGNSSPIKEPPKPVETKVEPPKPAAQKPAEKPKVEEPKITKEEKEDKVMKDLCDKLTVLKERGNTHYKRQAYKEAIKIFSEAVNTFEAAGSPMTDTAVKTVVTQLMTNRALSFHLLNQ